jgi:hypothetical protein
MDFSIPLVPLLNPDQETRLICYFMRGCGVDYNDFDFLKEKIICPDPWMNAKLNAKAHI